MQFSLKSSLCRFIRKSFVGIFKMNTDSCFRHPRDGTSCHRTLEDLASWTRRPRFSGRRPQDCNCCRVTQYRRVGVLHQVTQGFCSPPQLLSPLLSDSPPQLATPNLSLAPPPAPSSAPQQPREPVLAGCVQVYSPHPLPGPRYPPPSRPPASDSSHSEPSPNTRS